MSNLSIQKAKLAKVKDGDGLEVTIKRTEADNTITTADESHKALVHNNCKAAIQALGIHYLILTGYLKAGDVPDIADPDPELTEHVHVHGYSYGKDEENKGVTITATVHVSGTGGSVTANSPYKLFDAAPESRYVHMDDLIARLTECDNRVMGYIKGTERGTPAQQSMDFEQPVTKMQVAPPDEKVTPEGNLAGDKTKHQYANKDAMARVADLGNGQIKPEKKGGKGGKKKQQTPDNPAGETQEES